MNPLKGAAGTNGLYAPTERKRDRVNQASLELKTWNRRRGEKTEGDLLLDPIRAEERGKLEEEKEKEITQRKDCSRSSIHKRVKKWYPKYRILWQGRRLQRGLISLGVLIAPEHVYFSL